MTKSVDELLSMPTDKVERPKPMPAGSYVAQIKGFEFGESSKKKTKQVEFTYILLEPRDDVDMDLLAQVQGWQGQKTVRDQFYITPDALFRLTDFMTKHLGLNGTGRGVKELLPETIGQHVVVHLSLDIGQKREGSPPDEEPPMYNRVQGYSSVE